MALERENEDESFSARALRVGESVLPKTPTEDISSVVWNASSTYRVVDATSHMEGILVDIS